ncbi:MAG: NAD-dependent epimerase/dehydratase family protein [Bacteroidales bacterium]|nr:NAD-dependent epimerase/dehydratase family protein [Bacteroidales bacterium]MCM1415220.1 NAD-dependent epimerase/dehydratase family protein [bacterium]MCM1423786.1 NAD-dependent epimerase/dehydratase family protein [bacterium]
MKILVIGGSYFYGRVFVMEAAKEHEITVWNRGTYSMADFGVRQIVGDRHEKTEVCGEDFDAVIDFCAYAPGDIRKTVNYMTGHIGQYFLISTVDVYERDAAHVKTEETPFERRKLPGGAGAYIAGKVAAEEELREVCGARGIPFTVLRPAILYGPYNYAPRESVYIQMLLQNHALPQFTDADGRFQFVYVKDAAQAVLKCLGNQNAFGQAYNLCQDEILTYDSFFAMLRRVAWEEDGAEAAEVPLTLEQAVSQGVPTPFPATAAETHLCDNGKGKTELELRYTDFAEGMRRTYRAFRQVYLPEKA